LLVLLVEIMSLGAELLGSGECDDKVISGVEVTLHIDG
jgi:hypothetical protein